MVEATALSNTLDVEAARERLGEIIERVRRDGDRVEIEENGKTAAALIPMNDFRRLQALDSRRREQVRAIEAFSDAFRDVPVEELERQVGIALSEVRRKARQLKQPNSEQ